MSWLQIILAIIALLKQAKQADSAEAFATEAGAVGANGDFLKLLWAHRQEIIDFISMFFKSPQNVVGSTAGIDEAQSLLEELKS